MIKKGSVGVSRKNYLIFIIEPFVLRIRAKFLYQG